MLREARADELEELIDAFWPLAADLTRSTYPTYADGIKTCADFRQAVSRAYREAWGEVLVHIRNGADNGLIVLDVTDDAFISLHVCLNRTDQTGCLTEVLAYLRQKHAGKTLWLGFAPENAEMLAFAQAQGLRLLDDSVNWNISLADWQPDPAELPVTPVTCENYALFRALWTDEEMYWNADRIEAALERWRIFIMEDGCGAVACMDEDMMPEIFGFQYRGGYDAAAHRTLMTACLNDAKAKGSQYLTYFSDREEAPVMQALGFRRISGYCCYETTL